MTITNAALVYVLIGLVLHFAASITVNDPRRKRWMIEILSTLLWPATILIAAWDAVAEQWNKRRA